MLGTLARILAGKGIDTPAEHYWADVEGDIEDVDGVLKITQIRVNYSLAVPKGKTQDAKDCLANYIKYCPGAQSVIGCIDIKDQVELSELVE